MRILWMSDGPASPTGFGNVTRSLCAGLGRLGHEVSILAWQRRGRSVRSRYQTVHPAGEESREAIVLRRHLRTFRPDVLVTLADPWRVSYIAQPALADEMRRGGVAWAHYCPLDTDLGRARLPASTVELLEAVDLPIVMSRYGLRLARANGVSAAYIPHGVDTALFRPPANKRAAKRTIGYDRRFVVLSDARNQPRKMLPRLLEIFRRFAAGKRDVLLHLHCDPHDPAARLPEYHYDILSDIEFLSLEHKVRFTRGLTVSRGTSISRLAALYQAADVHLLVSFGEGFGLPSLQAAAAGVVPMAPAHSASRELASGHGEALRVESFVKDGWGLRRALVDVDDAVDRLERLYRDRTWLRARSAAARTFAEAYDWRRIVPRWNEELERAVARRRARRPPRGKSVSLVAARLGSTGHIGRSISDFAKSESANEVNAAIRSLERRGERTSAQVLRDALRFARPFTFPVTPLPTRRSDRSSRITGRVFLAGQADVAVFLALCRIFPGLSAWSTVALDLGNARRSAPAPARASSAARRLRAMLEASTLAIDVAGAACGLSMPAARAGVPSVGGVRDGNQRRVWPAPTLASPDVREAAEKCRWILTDHGGNRAACRLAHQRIRSRGNVAPGRGR